MRETSNLTSKRSGITNLYPSHISMFARFLFVIMMFFMAANAFGTSWITLTNGEFLALSRIMKVENDTVIVETNTNTRILVHIDSIQAIGRTGGSKVVGVLMSGFLGVFAGGAIGAAVTPEGDGHGAKLGGAIIGATFGFVAGLFIGLEVIPEGESYDLAPFTREEKIRLLQAF